MKSPVWHNAALKALLPKDGYRFRDLDRIEEEFARRGTLRIRSLGTGLFPAAAVATPGQTGYSNVWVRDNVYVAYAHHVCGKSGVAGRAARALFEFFWKYRHRFQAVIAGEADANDAMQRPHIRFDGEKLEELQDQRWAHAQNDALGYALWLFCELAEQGVIELDARVVQTLALFPRYFAAIRFWKDEDSGHWEETRRCSASSIGTVLAGLQALRALTQERRSELLANGFEAHLIDLTTELIQQGRAALNALLPNECVQLEPLKNRRYDAALLFLICPLDVVRAPVADLVLADIDRYLTSDCGVRRYLGDSYWAPNYDELLSPQDRTRDFSQDIETRDRLLDRIGHEAEWCIFDPLLSMHYGRRYRQSGSASDLARQVAHFERALSQITEGWQCPELYYIKHGVYVPNPHMPLLWTQANLMMALAAMRDSTNG